MEIVAIIVIAIVVIPFILKSNSTQKQAPKETLKEENTVEENTVLPYKMKYILTKNEYLFYKELKKFADANSLLICPKVGLKDLFETTDKKNYMSWFGKIAQKHVDFLICDDMLRPKYAIELDDNSHKENKENDKFKNELFKIGKLNLIRIKAQMEYSEEYILRNLDIKKDNEENKEV